MLKQHKLHFAISRCRGHRRFVTGSSMIGWETMLVFPLRFANALTSWHMPHSSLLDDFHHPCQQVAPGANTWRVGALELRSFFSERLVRVTKCPRPPNRRGSFLIHEHEFPTWLIVPLKHPLSGLVATVPRARTTPLRFS